MRLRLVGDEDVAPGDELAGHLLAHLGAEVDGDAELAGVVVVEVAADVVAGLGDAAGVEAVLAAFAVAVGAGLHGERGDAAEAVEVRLRLDADDGGAVAAEILGADGAGAEPGEVGDLDAFEG